MKLYYACAVSSKWKEIAIFKINRKVEGNSNFKIAILSTPYFLRDLKVEGNSNENGRK